MTGEAGTGNLERDSISLTPLADGWWRQEVKQDDVKIWSLRARVVLTTGAVTILVCVVLLFQADRTIHGLIQHHVDHTLISAAERLDARLAAGTPGSGLATAQEASRDLIVAGDVLGVVLFDGTREPAVAHPGKLVGVPMLARWPAAERRREREWSLDGAPVTARFVLLGNSRSDMLGAWLVVDRGEAESHLRRARTLLVGVAAVGLATGIALIWLWSGIVLKPVAALGSSLARLAGGELTWRHPERGPREIVGLARRINGIAEQLEASQTELTRSLSRENERTVGHARYLEQANRTLLDLANRDPLTGLANRRRLELELERHIDLARETGQPLAVVMMDLDNFKIYNDTAGHLAGDELLRTVASTLRGRTRITDLVVRWGGDEFCVLIPHTTPERALVAARSLVEAVAEATRSLPLPESLPRPGVSAGVAGYPEDGQEGTELIACADAALYRAKEKGRGQALRLSTE